MTLASRRNRSTHKSACRADDAVVLGRTSLMAACRASISWLAFHTSPMPPAPIGASNR
jgi:hypothetical protein